MLRAAIRTSVWSLPLSLALALQGSAALAQQPAAAPAESGVGDLCIEQSHAEEASRCPSGAVRFGQSAHTAPPAAARATQEERTRRRGPDPNARPTVALDEALRRRNDRLHGQSMVILQNEVRLTRQLAQNTPVSAPQRPDVLMRLSEALQELSAQENAQNQALNETIFQARQANNTTRVAELEREQQRHQQASREYRDQMIRVFEVLIRDHTNYARMDSVLFYLAFAYQDAGDMNRARQVYQSLIQRYPNSDYLPNAYLSFAEYFFEVGEMDAAAEFYGRVIAVNTATINPENNPVYGFALYKLAWVRYNQSRFEDALEAFFNVIDYAKRHPENPSTNSLLRQVRIELITSYGAVYGVSRPLRTAEALATFRRYAADENNAFEMLEKLGELYQDNGQWPNSIAVFHEMMAQRAQSDSFCKWESQVAKAVVASRPRDEQMREIERLIAVHDDYRGSQRGQDVKNNCRDYAARIVFDVSSHWHLEAIGRSAEGQQQTRGTRDRTTMTRASALYQALLDHFPDFDDVTYPDYNRTDWPSRYRVAYYRADLLRDMEDYEHCGPAYDAVVEMNPQGEYVEDSAYKAVLCYNALFSARLDRESHQRPSTANTGGRQQPAPAQAQATGPRGRGRGRQQPQVSDEEAARFAPREFNENESLMLRAFTRYICFAGAAAQAAPQPGQEDTRSAMLTIKYRRAYLYYNAHKYEEAATLFRDIAFSSTSVPDPENLREIAADLYLDSLNVMGEKWRPSRPGCYLTMEPEVPRLKEQFCGAASRAQHADFCDRMDILGCQILRKRSESLAESRRWAEAGESVLDIIRHHRECTSRPDAKVDEMLHNASIYFDAAYNLPTAIRIRTRLIEVFLPRNSKYAQMNLYRLARNFVAIQVFGQASDRFEQYTDYVMAHQAEATQAEAEAVTQAATALREATIYRIGLGQEQKALENAAKFARLFGAIPRFRRQSAQVVFAIGKVYEDRANRFARESGGSDEERGRRRAAARTAWQAVVSHYTRFVNQYAAQGSLDQKIQGNVALARGYWNLDNQAQAQLYYRAAVTLWGEVPMDAQGHPTGAAPGEGTVRQDLEREGVEAREIGEATEKCKDAVAEARFQLAEIIYQRFRQRRLPTFTGSNQRAFETWTRTALTPFVQTQQTYLRQDATREYTAVIAMRVPNWEIAAAARLADMYFQFSQIIRGAPVPPIVQRNQDLADAYRVAIDEQTQPLVNSAKEGYQACIQRATSVNWFNEWSQLCEHNLNEIDRIHFPISDEVRSTPNLVFSRATDARAVFRLQTAAEAEAERESGEATEQTNPPTEGAPAAAPAAGANP